MNRILTILLLLFGLFHMQAEPHITRNYAYRYYTTRDGLAQMQVLCAFQDKDGYMWFGTKGGVSRFDGVTFKNYTVEDGLPNGEVRTIGEWGRKKLFFYYTYFSILYENGRIETIDLPDSLETESKSSLSVELSDKNKLLILDLNLRNQPSNKSKYYHLIFDIRTKRFQKLTGFDKEVFNYNKKYFLAEDGVYACENLKFKLLAPYNKGRITNTAVNWDKQEFYIEKEHDSIICKYKLKNRKLVLTEKIYNKTNKFQGGQIFIILPDETLLFFNNEMKACFSPERKTGFGVNLSFLERLYIDREKNLWITTNNGLYNFFNLNIEEVKLNVSEPDDIWSVLEDDELNMWFGSYGNGLWKMNARGKLSGELETIKNSNLQYMASSKSKDGTLYFPTASGVIIYKKDGTATLTNTASCLSTYYDESDSRLLYSGVDTTCNKFGLYCQTTKKRKFYYWKKGFPVSIIKDVKGRIRLGSFHGQGIFTGDSIITDTIKRNYQGVICMSTDQSGRLWKGTNKGVFVEFPDGSEKRVSPTQINGNVTSILAYHNKYLLVGGVRSLQIVDIAGYRPETNPQVWDIGYDAGFTGLESGQNGFCEDHNGDVWLTTALSVMKFNPEKLVKSQNQLIPPIRISGLYYSKDNENWKVIIDPQSQTTDDLQKIAIKSSNKFIRFEYIANSISSPRSLRFKYRLTGFSEKWSEPVYTKEVSFTNLGYGHYCFEVQCSLDGIHWSPIARSQDIEIIVPFFLRPYSILVYVLLLVVLSIYATRLYVKKNQQKKLKELERVKLENELQLNTLRSKIIPHFTKNVLSAIGYFAMTDKLKAGHYISLFSEFTQSTLINADKNYITLQEELDYIEKYLELEKMRFGDKFDFEINVCEKVNSEILIPTMTLHTYCDNAIRHGLVHKEGKGFLLIEVISGEKGTSISISDNGIGRKKAYKSGTRGNGQGIRLIQAQLDFYNQINDHFISQTITDIENEKGNPTGTKVELFIPNGYRFLIS